MYQIKMNNPVVLIVFAILWLMEIYNCNDNYYQRTFRGMFLAFPWKNSMECDLFVKLGLF